MPTSTINDSSGIIENLFSDYSPDGDNLYCLTYSPSRAKFEIELLVERLGSNVREFAKNKHGDKRIFAIDSDLDALQDLKNLLETHTYIL